MGRKEKRVGRREEKDKVKRRKRIPISEVPLTSGSYMSSAFAGGTWKVPGTTALT